MDAPQTFQVFDWLWTSGQLSKIDILALPSMGINAVINLALPSSPDALAGEAELVTGQGLVYIQIPVEWEHPRVEQFLQFAGVVKAFHSKKIWVHCARNMRVSVFIYLYRKLILREAEQEAVLPMRHIWSPNETWQKFIGEVSRFYAQHPLQ